VAHAGLPLDIDWRDQDPVAIGHVADVVSHIFIFFDNFFTSYYEGEIQKRTVATL
jgi:hypothetical protein